MHTSPVVEQKKYEEYMKRAIAQAKISLREGNHGFGAIIIQENRIIAEAHDTEETERDPTAHAEMNVIRKASKKVGKDLEGCILIATHEPCPMCATAIVWANIKHIVFGFSIEDAIKQGRTRIGFSCEEIFTRANASVEIEKGIVVDECALLYNKDVRQEIEKLRHVTDEQLRIYDKESTHKRVTWYHTQVSLSDISRHDTKETAYQLLLKRFNITEAQAPIVQRDEKKLVFHSGNFCPTLEACKILELDTRYVCKLYNEHATDTLVKQIDPSLRFTRNYENLRPDTAYCEEMIIIDE